MAVTAHLPRAVLWDMDGTLVDSAEYHWEAWRETMAGRGSVLSRAEFDATFGQRNDTVLRRYVGPQITPSEIQAIGDAKEEHYRVLVQSRGIAPLPGVRDWLMRLHAAGWRQAIASSGPRLNTQTVLAALSLDACFDAIVAAEDVVHGKPDPEVFRTAAERLGVDPARCVVVEDAPTGIEAGRRAGMRTLGVLNTHPHLDADRLVHSLAELEPDAFEVLLID
jgi:beta-phosphoglucomutase family hydrolase